MQKIKKLIITGFYTGFSPVLPGTCGSLLAFPLCYILLAVCTKFKPRLIITGLDHGIQEIIAIYFIFFVVISIIFVFGVFWINEYIKETNIDDPKEVVIDEIAGQMLTIMLTFFATIFAYNSYLINILSNPTIDFIFLFFLPFITFRIFDILKPWPINWIDKNVKGGFGVMFDDIIAAVMASIMCYAITFVIIGDLASA